MHREQAGYAKWHPKNRSKTKTPEEAERILKNTGRLPRVIRLADIKRGEAPQRKSIVANQDERRVLAEMAGVYAVTKLQAKMLVQREQHPAWGYDRIMIYTKMYAAYIQPDATTNEPFEVEFPLKFKVAFREDSDIFFPTAEGRWNNELKERGLLPGIQEGEAVATLIKGTHPNDDVADNVFLEAILDNCVDLGELVLQHFAVHVDRSSINPKAKGRHSKRMSRRMSKVMGVNMQWQEINQDPEAGCRPSPQSIHDGADWSDERTLKNFPAHHFRKI